jgi:hypothetical protein
VSLLVSRVDVHAGKEGLQAVATPSLAVLLAALTLRYTSDADASESV